MAKPTVTSAYLRHEADVRLSSDVHVWGILRAAANTIDQLEQWKREAMQVLGDWHVVWEAAGKPGRLGQSMAGAVAARLEELEIRAAAVATEHQEDK